MDSEEVQYEDRHQDQRVVDTGLNGLVVPVAEVLYRICRLKGRDGAETDGLRTVGVLLGDDVVSVFIYATHGTAAEGIEIPVQLQDVVGARGDVFVGFVDRGQHVAVAGDLFLVPVPGLDFLLDNGLQALVSGIDALDAVGRIGALNLGDLQQGCKDVRLCLDEEFLATTAFMEPGQQGYDLRSEEVFRPVDEIKFVHSAYGLQGEDSVFLPQKRIICIKIGKMVQERTLMR